MKSDNARRDPAQDQSVNSGDAGANNAPYAVRPLCRRCFYFHPLGTRDPLMSGKGECWRFPPQGCPSCHSPDEYRITDEGGFCGEFEDRAHKIATFGPADRQLMLGGSHGR
jgi:hypothetical protein